MKNILITAISALALTACSTVNNAPLDRSIMPSASESKELKIGEHEEFTLENGMKVYVIENHKLPTISFSLSFDIDPIVEGERAGYTSMVGELMEAGTKNRTKENLNKEVDFIGANVGAYSGGVFASGLSKYNSTLMDILADVTLNPVFPEDELKKKITESITSIKSNSTNADAIMGDVKSVIMYGKGHPYGEFVTEASMGNITMDDVKGYYNTYFKPNNALLTIVGDITKSEAEELVKKQFGAWKKGEVPSHTYKEVAEPTEPQVFVVNKEGAVQSNIEIGNVAKIKLGDPDYEAIQVFNQIFGSGFAGRLFQNLREDKEYTYGAYGGIRANKLVGSFSSSAKVRNEVTDSAIEQFLLEINRIRTEPVTDEELKNAQNYLAGTFAQGLESPRTVARFAANIDEYKLDKDYFKNYLKRIDAVTIADIQRVATKYLKPGNINIIVVGEASEVGEKLARFGKLTYLDNKGNKTTAPSKIKAAPNGVSAETVMANHVKAIGGEDAVNTIKTLKIDYDMTMQGMNIIVRNMFKAPNKTKSEIIVPQMNNAVMQTSVFDGSKGGMKSQGQEIPVDEDGSKELNIEGKLVPELTYAKLGVKSKLLGIKKENGQDVYVIEATYPTGKVLTIMYDVQTNLKLKESYIESTPQGDFNITQSFMDYKAVNGVMIPHKVSQQQGPQLMDMILNSTEVNKPITDDTFKL
jgi:zinc protease